MPTRIDLPDYHEPRLADVVETLSPEDVNALPFGAIRLDVNGEVTFYSDAERRLSGYRKKPMGLSFFTEIAPCMNNAAFRGRIERALAAGHLDITFSHTGDFDDKAKELTVRVQSATGGGCWIFMKREACTA
jgi:photoactive yellow protein